MPYAPGNIETKRAKQRDATRRYQQLHPERVKASKDRARRKKLALLQQMKDVPCMDCGGRFPPCCMDFDHVNGGKEFTISLVVSSKTADQLISEAEKCEVVCANCHRIRTQRQHDLKRAGGAKML